MIRLAQVNKETHKLEMFVSFQTVEFAQAHISTHSDCFFVETDKFGSPNDFRYDETTNSILED